MEIIYDAEPKPRDSAGFVYVEDPVDERVGIAKYRTGGLELMTVDESYRLDPDKLPTKARQFLTGLRGAFLERRGDFITYQEVLDYARERVHFIPRDYQYNSHPVITQWMNMLWKAGTIQKFRRGLWRGIESGRWAGQITGKNFGITYWIW